MQSQDEQDGSSRQAAGGQEAAEQAGTMFGVQNLQTKGGGEESVQPASNQLQSYGNLSQEVNLPYIASSVHSEIFWDDLQGAGKFPGIF